MARCQYCDSAAPDSPPFAKASRSYGQNCRGRCAAASASSPDDIAGAAAFLTGPDSTFITGNDILVDGAAIVAQRWNTPSA